MQIYAIADLHLAIGVPEKTMEVFGEPWISYHEKIRERWEEVVAPEDVVLLPGDISWAMHIEEAKEDFSFIGSLPGTKYMIRGNHDYWSSASATKISKILPGNLHYLSQGFSLLHPKKAIVGARLWDSPKICIAPECFQSPLLGKERHYSEQDEKIFLRELGRLQRALESVPKDIDQIIVMTHYPPISSDGTPGPVSEMLEIDGRVSHCLFGHMHKVRSPLEGFGIIRDIDYRLVAADYIDFIPQVIK
ncbi:Predicted phosphoesterase or phosphohydrolase,Calcineurin-like phosphoesterase [Chlamydia poikilotherma]|uniref:Predicted phosphoesterase or phosphohydrolase,Calcineurin-like phosphoesterase n=1 Tax=Chlamydia poikilotherma TaxID=1967783 RepID=A0A3B0PYS4_9CHLA|nr:metallophosphoesterase [Chlamydia poikilotherma]SYX08625.1 Predicted phosphoesterase or phosphohydrolase,Calcineurin-like phosphoesterase [Chlamydia poikilotherma]